MRGIADITKGPVDLSVPPDMPRGEVWRYGLGFPFQAAPHLAGMFCNIRMEETGNIDLEIGSDVVLFDNLEDLSPNKALPLSRYERGTDPETGTPTITRKGPVIGGFVPLGAKLGDGSPHPHAGTGFGMCWAIAHLVDQMGHFDYQGCSDRYSEFFQFAFDGKEFRVLNKGRVTDEMLLSDWSIGALGLTNAIPDGQDLLFCMTATIDGIAVSGVARWRHGADGWCPISFVPVTGDEAGWGEPSLIRDGDGSLLFSARSSGDAVFDTAVWRSADNSKTWEQVIYRKECRARSPVSLNQAADGTPYIAANLPTFCREREILCVWPLNEGRTDLENEMIARNARAEFGLAPSGSWWRIDHPTSATVQLADGAWHSLLIYRILDNGEVESNTAPTPQTGCYVEEVFSRGEVIPTWRF